jgi:hypothetical protein
MKLTSPVVFKVVTVVLMIIVLGGCMTGNVARQEDFVTGDMTKKVARPEDFVTEEARLSEQIKVQTDPALLSDLYFQRAKLRFRSDTGHTDYRGARSDLRKAIDLQPYREDSGDINDLIAVLDRLGSIEQEAVMLKNSQIQAEQQIRSQQNDIEQLEKEKQDLRKKIDELESLDLQMEQMRQRNR